MVRPEEPDRGSSDPSGEYTATLDTGASHGQTCRLKVSGDQTSHPPGGVHLPPPQTALSFLFEACDACLPLC